MGRPGTLLALSMVAAVLAAVVALDRPGPRGTTRTGARLLPELERSEIAALSIDRSGQPGLRLVRGADRALIAAGRPELVLDAAAVADLEATLELLAYRRVLREKRTGEEQTQRGLQPPRLRVTLELAGGAVVSLLVGDRIPNADQYWLQRSGREDTFLVAGYAARALDRQLDDLRSRRPLRAQEHDVTGVELHAGGASLVLGGKPMAVHLEQVGGAVRADPGAVRALLERLDELRVREFVEPPGSALSAPDDALSVRVVGSLPAQELELIGACPSREDSLLARTPVGVGCIDRVRLEAIAGYAGAAERMFDARLVGTDDPREIAFSSAPAPWRLERSGRRWGLAMRDPAVPRDSQPADEQAVREWLTVVDRLPTGEHELRPTGGGAGDRLLAAVELSYDDGRRVRLGLLALGRKRLAIRRGDEPVVWGVGADAWALLSRAPAHFQPRQLLSLEPYALREARIWRGRQLAEHIERGELLEDWLARIPAGARVHPPAVAGLRETASHLRAQRFAAPAPAPAHGLTPPKERIELVFDPPPSGEPSEREPERHWILLGGPGAAGGCYAQLDASGAVFELSSAQCRALRGPWTLAR